MQWNIAERLGEFAARFPHERAVVFPAGRDRAGHVAYAQLTFAELDQESDRLARGLCEIGVTAGTRIVLMVRPGREFIALTYALLKAGAVTILIDPGMGRSNIFRCLQEVEPEGFIAIPFVHVVRRLRSRLFPRARFNVTVGRRFWSGPNYVSLRGGAWSRFELHRANATDPAAIIFTSGSTGPPKGVLYEHGMFSAQVDLLRDFYGIQPGEINLAAFPLFALFNSAMGVTTVIPDMDPTRPAEVDPKKIIDLMRDEGATQAFGSPALWNRVGRYAEQQGVTLPSLQRAFSAGAPVPVHVLERMSRMLVGEGADMHTPYGATESLPVCSISGREVLAETAERSRRGAGTCVGHPFPGVSSKVIEITQGPIGALEEVRELPVGEIGEIIVQGPSVTREYYRRPEATRFAKIPDAGRFWHRMGDVGYLDDAGTLWFCGRKAHIVETDEGRMFSVPSEAIFNEHPRVYRTALVGVGAKHSQEPVVVVEPEQGCFPRTASERERFRRELIELGASSPSTAKIRSFLFHTSLPVDIRHNVKIFREKLAQWAEKRYS
jgi:acyl-CoA synthetase (AMP-forming)/AMP-acid ligase II